MEAYDLHNKAELKGDLYEMINVNTDLAALYMNITTHILSHTKHGVDADLTADPRGIKISPISLDNEGNCQIQVTYPI